MIDKSTIVRYAATAAGLTATLAPGLAARILERLFLTPFPHKPPARENAWMATARRSTLRFDASRRLPIYSWGSGPTVLLAHGWSGRGSQLGAFVEPLLQRGYRVVAFDGPAHGNADGRLTGLPEFAAAIEKVAHRVGPVHAIVAHSMGAAATTVALSRGLSVDRLVYIAPPANPAVYLARAAREIGFGDEVARRTRARIERRFGFRFERARGTALAPSLDVPLLIIHDIKDREVPYQEGARLVECWPGAELMSTIGLGHSRILRAPAVLQKTATFLPPASGSASGSLSRYLPSWNQSASARI